jgi:hypothetical protein
VRPRVAVIKQLKDAVRPNSSAIWPIEDAEMRRSQTASGVQIRPTPTPIYQMKMSCP